ncbi:MAG: SIS domain-containing protein [Phycisphaerales bacterium]|nr:SIS domain-containing protein [Phycisphaerales bacterium]
MGGTVCNSASSYFEAMRTVMAKVDAAAVDRYADTLFKAWKDRRRVFVFGNGGSASTASHHVCDYVKTAMVPGQPRLLAFSLVDNVGLTTAIGNDLSYEETFSFPLESVAQRGDVAVAISCSGNSPNVVRAAGWAIGNGLTLVGLTGFKGGRLGELSNIHIHVPSDNYGVIEDLHLSIGHIATQMLFGRVKGEKPR